MRPKDLLLSFTILLFALFNSKNAASQDCIIINGGGYSGFWYYYGYLQKNNINKTVYCYSGKNVTTQNDRSYSFTYVT
jgi:hypothetical protein